MQLTNSGNSAIVESSGVGATSAVQLADSPHMFAILSNGLYSDKVAAVLREIGCNAMDAHIMFGQPDLPFEVKLPSLVDRTFYVKDWGPGLDDREFRQHYTTYGWSDKQERNDATGAFGLGAKSPFAYTLQNKEASDGFTVETAKNGSRRVYTCYIGETGKPLVSLLYEGPTEPDWPHGLKVTFPVQSEDIAEFHEKAHLVLSWFTVLPTVLGLTKPLVAPEYRLRGKSFGVRKEGGAEVISGNVRYPLRKERFQSLTPLEQGLLERVTLHMPIGSVKMTPAREELEYTKETRNALTAALRAATVELAQTLLAKVTAPAPSRWEWARSVLDFYDSLPSTLQTRFQAFLESGGMTASEAERIVAAVTDRSAKAPSWLGGQSHPVKVFHYEYDPFAGVVRRYTVREGFTSKRPAKRDAGPVELRLSYRADASVVVADGKQADARMREHVLAHKGNHLLLVPEHGADSAQAHELAHLLVNESDLKGLPLHTSSKLPAPTKVTAARSAKKAARALTPREQLKDKVFETWNLSAGSFDKCTLGELAEDEVYYLVHPGSGHSWSSFESPASGGAPHMNLPYNNALATLRALPALLPHLGMRACRIVLVRKATQLKPELGFKPFLQQVYLGVKSSAKMQALLENYGDKALPAVSLTWMGTLVTAQQSSSPLWAALSNHTALHPLMLRILADAARFRPLPREDLQLIEIVSALAAGQGHPADSTVGLRVSVGAYARRLDTDFPFLTAVLAPAVREWVKVNPDGCAAMLAAAAAASVPAPPPPPRAAPAPVMPAIFAAARARHAELSV